MHFCKILIFSKTHATSTTLFRNLSRHLEILLNPLLRIETLLLKPSFMVQKTELTVLKAVVIINIRKLHLIPSLPFSVIDTIFPLYKLVCLRLQMLPPTKYFCSYLYVVIATISLYSYMVYLYFSPVT